MPEAVQDVTASGRAVGALVETPRLVAGRRREAAGDGVDFLRADSPRPGSARDRMAACLQAVRSIGVVQNAVHMMAEFCTQGIDLVHEQAGPERVYKEWWRKVRGAAATEQFLTLLYAAGNAPVKRSWARLTLPGEKALRRGAAPDAPAVAGGPVRLPWAYTVLNPLSLEIAHSPDLAPLLGRTAVRYGVRLNTSLIDQLTQARQTRSPVYLGFGQEIDSLLMGAAGGDVVPLNPSDTRMLFYKKYDWELWATPMLWAVFSDLKRLEELKAADSAALAGAISQIRVWALGDLKTVPPVYPNQAMVDKLADILSQAGGGGPADIIWDRAIELIETNTDIHHFLGEEKYRPTMAAIYGGLGIPPQLTGLPAPGGGATNNFLGLKTLTERLEYGRQQAREFWAEEVRLVQRAMGFRRPAELVFDQHSLSDEAAQLRLLVELLDRNVVSREAVLERFGFVPEVEKVRTARERRGEDAGAVVRKAGPWDQPHVENDFTKLFIQTGVLSPADVGLDIDAPAPVDVPADLAGEAPKGKPGQGRPPGKTDSRPRRRPTFRPRAARVVADTLKGDFEGATGRPVRGDDLPGLTRAAARILAAVPAGRRVTPGLVRRTILSLAGAPGGVSGE